MHVIKNGKYHFSNGTNDVLRIINFKTHKYFFSLLLGGARNKRLESDGKSN